MRFSEVTGRALRDENFARELQEQAAQAANDGVGSEAWIKLARNFAENEEELSFLIPPTLKQGSKFDATTLSHLIILSGGTVGTTTTTTTTTSRFCSIPTICEKANVAAPRRKRGAKAASKKRK